MLLSVAAVLLAAVGQFEGHADVGAPKLAGSAAYNAVTQEYALSAAGTNMWAQRDEFHFAWKRLSGDFILQARVELLGSGRRPAPQARPHRAQQPGRRRALRRRGRPRRRPHLAPVPPHEGRASPSRSSRPSRAPTSSSSSARAHATPCRSRASASRSRSARSQDLALGDEVYVGPLPLLAQPGRGRAGGLPQRADHPAGEGRLRAVPRLHRQRTSRCSTSRRGDRQVVHASGPTRSRRRTGRRTATRSSSTRAAAAKGGAGSTASTWRRASRPSSTPAFANRNNNDHVLSFDGTHARRSATRARPAASRRSTRCPATGGTPKRITPLTPSYLHGWSPDGEVRSSTPAAATTSTTSTRSPSDGSGPR